MKRITWWPQLFLGITFNFGALIGWAAVTGVVGLPALLLYLGGIFWTLGYDTIYAHQDKEDDIKIGIKSSALKLGESSKKWVKYFYIAALILIAGSFYSAGAGWLSYLLLALSAKRLLEQVKKWDVDDPMSSLKTFKSNRNWGILVLIAAMV